MSDVHKYNLSCAGQPKEPVQGFVIKRPSVSGVFKKDVPCIGQLENLKLDIKAERLSKLDIFQKNFSRVGQVKDSDLSAVAEFMPVSDIFKEDFPCIGLVEHSDLGIIAEPSAAFDGFQHYLVSVRPVEDLELDFFPEAVRVVFDEFKKNLFCVRQLKQPGEKLYTGQYAVFGVFQHNFRRVGFGPEAKDDVLDAVAEQAAVPDIFEEDFLCAGALEYPPLLHSFKLMIASDIFQHVFCCVFLREDA